jgi:hypothetical protein
LTLVNRNGAQHSTKRCDIVKVISPFLNQTFLPTFSLRKKPNFSLRKKSLSKRNKRNIEKVDKKK